jgi:hypothetical protein
LGQHGVHEERRASRIKTLEVFFCCERLSLKLGRENDSRTLVWGLSLATFVARLDGADVPGLIVSMGGAEPPSADAAVESCGKVAGFSHRRNGLTGPFEVPGIGVIRLL